MPFWTTLRPRFAVIGETFGISAARSIEIWGVPLGIPHWFPMKSPTLMFANLPAISPLWLSVRCRRCRLRIVADHEWQDRCVVILVGMAVTGNADLGTREPAFPAVISARSPFQRVLRSCSRRRPAGPRLAPQWPFVLALAAVGNVGQWLLCGPRSQPATPRTFASSNSPFAPHPDSPAETSGWNRS